WVGQSPRRTLHREAGRRESRLAGLQSRRRKVEIHASLLLLEVRGRPRHLLLAEPADDLCSHVWLPDYRSHARLGDAGVLTEPGWTESPRQHRGAEGSPRPRPLPYADRGALRDQRTLFHSRQSESE